ncbi:MAG: enolase C-terminal domain-like protein [Synechococcus sp.]
MTAAEGLRLAARRTVVPLPPGLRTHRGAVGAHPSWLLRLDSADGRRGWGEAVVADRVLDPGDGVGDTHGTTDDNAIAAALAAIGPEPRRQELEDQLPQLPRALAFGLGLALAELDGLGSSGWRSALATAWLLPGGAGAVAALESLLARRARTSPPTVIGPLTVKWKVAVEDAAGELALLERLLRRLPATARLRLDANGGWDRPTAARWAERLLPEPRLEWLEQPLPPEDHAGLRALALQLPVALDESLRHPAGEPSGWGGWRVHRPALEGDPRPLLRRLAAGEPRRTVSTAFETGIGRRALDHLAALQWAGPTPCAAGLAPGWEPPGPLASRDPKLVWAAAAP